MKKNDKKQLDDEQYFNTLEQASFAQLSYEEQTKIKQKLVMDAFHYIEDKKIIKPIVIAEHPRYYRHKVTTSAINVKSHGKRKIKFGFFVEHTHKIKPVFESILHDKSIDKTLKETELILQKYKITAYEKGYNKGIIKHVLVRKSFFDDEMLLVFVTQGFLFPNAKQIIKELREKNKQIISVVQIIQNKETPIVLYGEENILFGAGYITDHIADLSFRLSAKSFYQVNPEQMMKLYRHAFDLVNIQTKERVMDCYSGIGTLSLLAAKQAQSVIAIELNASAVKDAIGNAKRNQLTNVEFKKDDVERFVETYQQTIDVLMLDPPRIGASIKFINAIKRLKPKRIIYISCFVETQARDMRQLSQLYHVENIQPVDMFPYTTHVENIALLKLKERYSL